VGLGRFCRVPICVCACSACRLRGLFLQMRSFQLVQLFGAPTEQRNRVRNRLFPLGQMPRAPTQQCSCLAALESSQQDSGVGSAGCTVSFGSVSPYLRSLVVG